MIARLPKAICISFPTRFGKYDKPTDRSFKVDKKLPPLSRIILRRVNRLCLLKDCVLKLHKKTYTIS